MNHLFHWFQASSTQVTIMKLDFQKPRERGRNVYPMKTKPLERYNYNYLDTCTQIVQWNMQIRSKYQPKKVESGKHMLPWIHKTVTHQWILTSVARKSIALIQSLKCEALVLNVQKRHGRLGPQI